MVLHIQYSCIIIQEKPQRQIPKDAKMESTPKCLLKIRLMLPLLHGKYKDLANQILAAPERFIRGRAKDTAMECGCDESMVVRFCQKLGYKGIPDLKASIASEFMPISLGPSKGDSIKTSFEAMKLDFLERNNSVISGAADMLVEADLEKALDLLTASKRIFAMGVGISGIVALDAQAKLTRLGFNVVCHPDPNLSLIIAGLAGHGDTLLAISYSGETKDTCHAARHFKSAGGRVLSITKSRSSSLAKDSDVIFTTPSEEGIFRLGAMLSRQAQMFIVDIIILSLALRDMEKCQKNILKTHSMIPPKMDWRPQASRTE